MRSIAMKIRSGPVMAAASLALVLSALSAPAGAGGKPPSALSSGAGTAAMTAAPQKPNGSGVSLQYRFDAAPQAGRSTPVTLEFDGVTDPAGASVHLRADSGLSFSGPAVLTLPAGQSTTLTVNVTSEGPGLTYLNVFTAQNGARGVVSIPVQVGADSAPSLKSSPELTRVGPDGERIISMPVD
jgi:hypothetical protein